MTRHVTLVALAALLAIPTRRAEAQASLITGLGGPLDYGASSPPRGDDGSTPTAVSLAATFPSGIDFYGQHFTDVFVNINGSITFGAADAIFTPDPFPRPAGGVPMIAAWWADVDTRPILAGEPNGNQIYYAATPTHFVVTWIDVGYFDMKTDRLDAFQIVLSPAASGTVGAFDVQLRYHRCEWTTGDARSSGGMGGLGGHPAQAGFDAADGVHYVTLPGSRSSAVLDLCVTTNGTMPGVWDLTSVIAAPVCGNGFRETGEDCDDGNTEPHDRCDDACHVTVPCLSFYPDGAVDDPFAHIDARAGDANGADASLYLPPCMTADDAGRRDDAGTRFDAGVAVDASVGMDTGPHVDELDVTGGGCGCRATRARSSTALSGLALALLVITRLRARAGIGPRA